MSPEEAQARITAYWDERAPEYDRHQQRGQRLAADRAVWGRIWEQTLPVAPVDVLDLGTGSGHVALLLARLGHRVTGTDLSTAMLGIARRHAEEQGVAVRFAVGDAAAPETPDGGVDVVVSRYLLWTLRRPGEALRAWRRALRPGGLLAVVDGLWFPHGIEANPTPGFREHYDERVRAALPLAEASRVEELTGLIGAAGFRDVRVRALQELWELDRATGVVPGHDLVRQHLITARA